MFERWRTAVVAMVLVLVFAMSVAAPSVSLAGERGGPPPAGDPGDEPQYGTGQGDGCGDPDELGIYSIMGEEEPNHDSPGEGTEEDSFEWWQEYQFALLLQRIFGVPRL